MLEIRPAQPPEFEAIGELTARTYREGGYFDPSYEPILRDVAGRATQADILAALVDGHLVGAVAVASRGGDFAEKAAPGEAVIRMLVTAPEARGAGVGTALVQACLESARAAGCSVVRLSTVATMTAAHRIYGRLGFTRTPDRDWQPVPGLTLLTYELPVLFCGDCGEPLRGDSEHQACRHRLELEPPRYCARCRRRMVVQVHPTGWSAKCAEHGTEQG